MLGRSPYSDLVGPEFVRDDIWMRVDGDVFEVWTDQYHRRIPLAWLVVRAQALRRERVQIDIGLENVDQPLYALATPVGSQRLAFGIDAAEEPTYRAFFAQVAQLCGRTVAQVPGE